MKSTGRKRSWIPYDISPDGLRPHLPALWNRLPPEEKSRFLRHVRPYWDVHRHRMAPEIARRIADLQQSGHLSILAGRQDHLIHHREAFLTDPGADPETWYLSGAVWHRLGWSGRTLRRIENTFSGRVLLGPIGVVSRFLVSEARQIAAGCRETAAIWLVHGVGVAAVLVWVLVVCRIPLHVYVVGFIYPGLALALIRSFAEHRAAEIPGHRTAIVEDRGPLALLFLHNNLHVVHHRRPDLPWFAIPACYHAERSEFIRRNGGLVYRSYGEVAVRFLVKPHHEPPHPMTATATD
jgi:fatty acid desaturase